MAIDNNIGTPPDNPANSNTVPAINGRWLAPDGEREARFQVYSGEGLIFINIDGTGALTLPLNAAIDTALRLIGAITRERQGEGGPL
jgi:hypothetical protein